MKKMKKKTKAKKKPEPVHDYCIFSLKLDLEEHAHGIEEEVRVSILVSRAELVHQVFKGVTGEQESYLPISFRVKRSEGKEVTPKRRRH